MKVSAGKLWGMRRLADASGRFKMTAVDQRPPIKQLVAAARGTSTAADGDVRAVKRLLLEELATDSSAVLLDPHFAYPAGIDAVPPAKGLLLTLEDSVFEETDGGRRSSEIGDWSVEKIKRAGADAVKALAWYRPDAAEEISDHQRELVARMGAACRRYDIPFIFELLTYPFPGEGATAPEEQRADHVIGSVAEFSSPEYGVDLFKLESPVHPANVPDPNGDEAPQVQAIFDELGRTVSRPWVMLSAGAQREAFSRVLAFAYRAGASGFLAGRAIWWEPLQSFPDVDAARSALRTEGVAYLREIGRLTDAEAMPFHEHTVYGADGPSLAGDPLDFRATYDGIGGEG
ncbi:MAG: tagatose 1,6-diphosphate aldolase [Actinomycetota bacterium]